MVISVVLSVIPSVVTSVLLQCGTSLWHFSPVISSGYQYDNQCGNQCVNQCSNQCGILSSYQYEPQTLRMGVLL